MNRIKSIGAKSFKLIIFALTFLSLTLALFSIKPIKTKAAIPPSFILVEITNSPKVLNVYANYYNNENDNDDAYFVRENLREKRTNKYELFRPKNSDYYKKHVRLSIETSNETKYIIVPKDKPSTHYGALIIDYQSMKFTNIDDIKAKIKEAEIKNKKNMEEFKKYEKLYTNPIFIYSKRFIILTIIDSIIMLLFGFRKIRTFLVVALVNILSILAINLFIRFGEIITFYDILFKMEVLKVAIEVIVAIFLIKEKDKKSVLIAMATANILTIPIGFLLFK